MTPLRCPTCGASVRVVSSGEGTNYYEPLRQDEPGLREALTEILAAVDATPADVALETWVRFQSAMLAARAALRAAPAEPETAVEVPVRLPGESPCSFTSGDGWYVCEVHGWSGPPSQRSRVLVCPDANISPTATEPADGTLDEAWKAAEAALPKRHSLHLDTNGRGTYVACSLPPFMPYEEWFEARREEFGDSPAEAVAALAAALSKPASPAIAARDGGET